jgi:hypothetical protein
MQTPTAVNSNQMARSAPYAVSTFALSTCRWEVSACKATHQIPTKSAQTAPLIRADEQGCLHRYGVFPGSSPAVLSAVAARLPTVRVVR